MANNTGRAAKRTSRRCFTLVRVTTPTTPRTPLPTKFAAAEKHIARLLQSRGLYGTLLNCTEILQRASAPTPETAIRTGGPTSGQRIVTHGSSGIVGAYLVPRAAPSRSCAWQ